MRNYFERERVAMLNEQAPQGEAPVGEPAYYAHRIERALEDSADEHVALHRGFLADAAKVIRAATSKAGDAELQPSGNSGELALRAELLEALCSIHEITQEEGFIRSATSKLYEIGTYASVAIEGANHIADAGKKVGDAELLDYLERHFHIDGTGSEDVYATFVPMTSKHSTLRDAIRAAIAAQGGDKP